MRALLGCAALFAAAAYSQTPKFDAAGVHADTGARNSFQGGTVRAGSYELRHATMVDLIRTAYSVDADTILGGPAWLEFDRFTIAAKAPANSSPQNLKLMLQSLLADRFKLVVHKDTRPMPGFVLSEGLVLSEGKAKVKLKPATGSGEQGCQPPPPEPLGPNAVIYSRLICRNMSMEDFATYLRQAANAYVTGPVIDSTAIKGSFDFELKWSPKGVLASSGSDSITLFDAIDKQLGLKLESQKVPMPVLVVDSVNEKPSPDPPNIATALPPAPPLEFEVASIRPSQGFPALPPRLFEPGGRVNFPAVPLTFLIYQAFNLQPGQDIPGAPKWLNTAMFDLVAKAPAGVMTSTPANPANIDPDDLNAMFRALLIDRFKLQTHYEDRPVPVYALVSSGKPKLKPAAPSNRTGCKMTIAPRDPENPGPPPFQVACQNITMAQFAQQLPSIAGTYTQYPAIDSTGLEGAWDFSLTFSPRPPNGGGGGGRGGTKGGGPAPAPAADAGIASDPSGVLSLGEAIDKQLGLKIETRQRPMPVLVIDHIEEKPTDN